MKVWICKIYNFDGSYYEFDIAHVYDTKQKAIDWKEKNPGYYSDWEEREIE